MITQAALLLLFSLDFSFDDIFLYVQENVGQIFTVVPNLKRTVPLQRIPIIASTEMLDEMLDRLNKPFASTAEILEYCRR